MDLYSRDAAVYFHGIICFLATISLAFVVLDAALAQFASVIYSRAITDLANTTDAVSSEAVRLLMDNVTTYTFIISFAALFSLIVGFIGYMSTYHLKSPPEYIRSSIPYCIVQSILGLCIVVTAVSMSGKLHSSQASFDMFGADDKFPYYGIMYYGSMAQMAFGSLLIGVAVVFLLGAGAVYYFRKIVHESHPDRLEEEAAKGYTYGTC